MTPITRVMKQKHSVFTGRIKILFRFGQFFSNNLLHSAHSPIVLWDFKLLQRYCWRIKSAGLYDVSVLLGSYVMSIPPSCYVCQFFWVASLQILLGWYAVYVLLCCYSGGSVLLSSYTVSISSGCQVGNSSGIPVCIFFCVVMLCQFFWVVTLCLESLCQFCCCCCQAVISSGRRHCVNYSTLFCCVSSSGFLRRVSSFGFFRCVCSSGLCYVNSSE